MTRKRPTRGDALEAAIEDTLRPEQFIRYGAGWDFVSELEEVAGKIEKLVANDAARAVRLYETFLNGCYEKAEEIDDSSGNLGMFVDSLFCDWIKARQASGADAHETATLLLDRMENDPYGFAYDLERDAVKVMSKDSIAAFERAVRDRFEGKNAGKQTSERDVAYARRQWGEVLRAIYVQQNGVAFYVALCEATELTAQDCLAIATMHKARRKPDEALAWVERGLALDKKHPHGSTPGHDLAKMKRELLTKLGRSGDALDEAWAEFRDHPSKYTYKELMRFVPKGERQATMSTAVCRCCSGCSRSGCAGTARSATREARHRWASLRLATRSSSNTTRMLFDRSRTWTTSRERDGTSTYAQDERQEAAAAPDQQGQTGGDDRGGDGRLL